MEDRAVGVCPGSAFGHLEFLPIWCNPPPPPPICCCINSLNFLEPTACTVLRLYSCFSGCLKSLISFSRLPASIKGDSNDAVWFPVYSLLVCNDKRKCWCRPNMSVNGRVKVKVLSLSFYRLLFSILHSHSEPGWSVLQGEYSVTYRISMFANAPTWVPITQAVCPQTREVSKAACLLIEKQCV